MEGDAFICHLKRKSCQCYLLFVDDTSLLFPLSFDTTLLKYLNLLLCFVHFHCEGPGSSVSRASNPRSRNLGIVTHSGHLVWGRISPNQQYLKDTVPMATSLIIEWWLQISLYGINRVPKKMLVSLLFWFVWLPLLYSLWCLVPVLNNDNVLNAFIPHQTLYG